MSIFKLPPAKGIVEFSVSIEDDSATTIVDASAAGENSAVFIAQFSVDEIAGGTPNLTVDIFDGVNPAFLGDAAGNVWRARPVSPNKGIAFAQGYILPVGSKLRVTSSNPRGGFQVRGLRALLDGMVWG